MTFHKLTSRDQLVEGFKQGFKLRGVSILLVHSAGQTYAIENKCGHFGVPLVTGRILGARIQCSQHGAEFDLSTGQVLNRVVAQCDPLRVFGVTMRGDEVGIEFENTDAP